MHDAMEDRAEEPDARDPIDTLDEQATVTATVAAAGLVTGISAAYDRWRASPASVRNASAASGQAKPTAGVPHATVTPALWLPLPVPVSEAAPVPFGWAPTASPIVEPEAGTAVGPAAQAAAAGEAVATPEPEPHPSHVPPLPPKWSITLADRLDVHVVRETSRANPVEPDHEPAASDLDWRPLAVPPAPPPRRLVSIPPRHLPSPGEGSPQSLPMPADLPEQATALHAPPHQSHQQPDANVTGAAAPSDWVRSEPAPPTKEPAVTDPIAATPFALRPAEFRFETAPGGSDSVATLAAAAAPDTDPSLAASPPATIETAATEPKPGRFGSYVRNALRFVAYAFALWFATMVLLILLFRFVDPPSSMLMVLQRLSGTEVERQWVPLSQMSNHLKTAVVVSEDARFCTHWGIDPNEIAAAIARARDGVPRGASTITMQVAKNLFLWPSKSYFRKALEVPLTLAIELLWSKSRILEVYLNVAEWGPGIFGAEAAARHHFAKPAAKLAAREAALLAVALPSPATRDAGDPGIGTARLARAIEVRMRARPRAAHCVAPSP